MERLATGPAPDRSDARAPVEESGAATSSASRTPLRVRWLGRVAYRDAWDLQHRCARARAAGLIADQLVLLEHDPVLTLGKHADEHHVRATPKELRRRAIEVIRVERGGEVTYHGPGQLVAYPIIRLADRGLLLKPYVRALEAAMIEVCAIEGVAADRREGHPGCWCAVGTPEPRKIGALGVRVERGVTYHGIALNVDPDLRDFELIDPCGMPHVISTSIAEELGRTAEPPTTAVVGRAGEWFARGLAEALGATLEGDLPPAADVDAERASLEAELARAEAALAATAASPDASAAPASGDAADAPAGPPPVGAQR
ncbi:MAG: lipoyl(octanoyl) transferase LipB [Chloroflexi bacterium]|nr:lipoyl(octanoyl) transferase LipB [Chloroflexota bacterium]